MNYSFKIRLTKKQQQYFIKNSKANVLLIDESGNVYGKKTEDGKIEGLLVTVKKPKQ